MFLGLWLLVFVPSSGWLLYETSAGGSDTGPILKLTALEVIIFAFWAFYWMILYPRYFTTFRNIATPKVRIAPFVSFSGGMVINTHIEQDNPDWQLSRAIS